MSDFHLVDPQGWEYDLQSVYSAYMGFFQLHGVQWHDRTWGQFFETFEQFLAFSWPVVAVTDARTGRAHIVTRKTSVAAFLKMIRTRFGDSLPEVDNMLLVTPLETTQRHLRHVNDWAAYKKLHATLPAVALASFKARVRGGDPSAIRQLWATRDKTFLALDFECLERNDRSLVEWGYAVIRSSHLEAVGAWPPLPDTNYRKGHYIISEYVDGYNKASPTVSWQYAFGDSQVIPKTKLPRIIQSVLSSLLSPESETVSNNVVLVGHGIQAVMQRLEDMKIKIPNNVLVLDVAYFERALFIAGERGAMRSRRTGMARMPESLLGLAGILHSLGIEVPSPPSTPSSLRSPASRLFSHQQHQQHQREQERACVLYNAGNHAVMTLVAFQKMVMGDSKSDGAVEMGWALGAGNAKWNGNGNGNGNGSGKGAVPNGNGHVKRAATVAARIFRPLASPSSNPNLNLNGHSPDANGTIDLTQTRNGRSGGGGGVDEMGVNVKANANAVAKRASMSMLSAWTSPRLAPTEKNKKAPNSRSTSGNGGGAGLSPSAIATGQRRHSVGINEMQR